MFEYIVGWLLEVIFKTKYWDYSKKMFNIHGRVCLQNSLYWGVLGVFFMKVIHPIVEKSLSMIPELYVVILVAGAMTIMVVDTVITVIGLVKINVRLKDLEEITDSIRAKIEAINLKNAANLEKIRNLRLQRLNKISASVNNNDVLGELKRRQEFYQQLLEKRIRRLRRAFPTMSSERLSKFLNNHKKS